MEFTALYPRVSTGLQVNEGTSLEGQETICRKKAAALGIPESEILVYREEGFTGEDIDRPALNRLMEDVKAGKIKRLILTHPDRLTRDLTDKLIICRELEKNEVELIFCDTEYKDTPEGQLFFNMMSSIAQYELSLIKKRTVRGRLKAVEHGKKIMPMRVATYGYDLVDGKYIVNENEAKFVRLIFQWYVYEGKTFREIGDELYKLGAIPKRAESKNWSASSLGKVLSNEAYIGKYYYNRRETKKVKGEKTASGKAKKTRKMRDKSEWILVEVPSIIDSATFDLAQQQKVKNFTRLRGNMKHSYLLKSLMTCSNCGKIWQCTSYSSKSKEGVSSYPIYRCGNKYPKRYGEGVEKCDTPTIRADVLDKFVWNLIVNALSNPEKFEKKLKTESMEGLDDLRAMIVLYEKQLQAITKEKDKVKLMFRKDIIDEDELDKDIKKLNKDAKNIEQDIENIQEKLRISNREIMSDDLVRNIIERYRHDLLNPPSFEYKRNIIQKLVDRIIINYDHQHACFKLSFIGYLSEMYQELELSEDNLNSITQPQRVVIMNEGKEGVSLFFEINFSIEQLQPGSTKPREIIKHDVQVSLI